MNENLQNENSTPLETQNVTPNVPQNNMEGEAKPKKDNKKIVIGVIAVLVVAIIAVVVAKVFFINDPKEVFESSITTLFDYMEQKTNEYVPNEMNLEENDLMINGTISFNTNQDLGELEDLKNYAVDLEIGVSLKNEILKANIGLLENSQDFLAANVFVQDGHAYIKMPELLNETIDNGEYDWDSSVSVTSTTYTKEDYLTIIRGTKEMLIASINKDKITTQKDITLEGSSEKVTEITYAIDKETYNEMLNSFYNYMTNHNDYVEALAKVTSSDAETILEAVGEARENNSYEGGIKISIYTKGLQNEIVEAVIDDGETSIRVKIDGDKYTLLNNNNSFTLREADNILTIDYDVEDYTGTITIENKGAKENSNAYTVNVLTNSEDVSFELSMDLGTNYDANLEKEELGTVIDINALTEEQSATILNNLLTKIEGTPFETLLQYYIIAQSDNTDNNYTY